jgi:hypothetical protein
MSDKPVSRGQRGVDAYLDGLTSRNELIPGAREYLARRFASSNKHGGLRSLVGCLAFGDCRRYLTHERESPARPESPLHALVRRLAPAFTSKAAAEDFYAAVAIKFTHDEAEREPERVAEQLWDMLQDKFEYRHILIDPPPLDRRSERVREALQRVAHHLRPNIDLDMIAHEWKHLGDMTPEEAARAVAARLAMPQYAADLTPGGRPVRVPFAEYADEAAPADPDALRIEFAKMGDYQSF